MKNNKINNNQKNSNNLNNVKMNAGRDIINGPVNINHTEDNTWLTIPRKDNTWLEIVGKFIISHIGEIGSKISAMISFLYGGFLFFKNAFTFLLTYRPNVHIPSGTGSTNFSETFQDIGRNVLHQFTSVNFILAALGAILILIGILIFNSIEYKNDSTCPKCKKHYALIEVGNSKEKQARVSGGYRVNRIRNYKCSFCSFEKKNESSFFIPDKLNI